MAARDAEQTQDRSLVRGFESVSRYDFVLAIIPVAFLLAGVASQVLSVAPHVLLVGATLVCAIALVDGLFLNPPRPGSRPR